MSGIVKLLEDLRRQDVKFWLDGAELRVSAPPGVLTPALIAELQRSKPELCALLRGEAATLPTSTIETVPRGGPLPASFAQQQLWVLDKLGQGLAYHSQFAARIEGRLHVPALEQALGEVVRRHESLRTTFLQEGGEVRQIAAPPRAFSLIVTDLRALDPEAKRAALTQWIEADGGEVFDLSRDALLRGRILRLDEEEAVLLLSIHHIAFDGWSIGVLSRELDALYDAFREGRPSPLAELPFQYADHSVWQRRELSGARLSREIEHWRERLSGAPTLLDLPIAVETAAGPARPSQRAGTVTFRLGVEVSEGLRRIARGAGASLFMTTLAVFQVLLARYTGQLDVLVGTPVANRNKQGIESLIGYFVNTVVLRADLSGEPTFLDLLTRVRETTLTAFEHEELPFERLVEALQVERVAHRSPLVQVLFAVQNASDGRLSLPGLRVSPFPLEQRWSRMDLEVDLIEEGREISCVWVYDRGKFEAGAMERMALHFQNLLAAVVAEPTRRALELPILSEEERDRILVAWNGSTAAYPDTSCIHELFEAQAARTPDATAVVFDAAGPDDERGSLTYRALDERANRLAHHLRALGAGRGALVALCVDRSLEQIVAMLGVLKAGCAYVPIDPAYPEERKAFLLDDTRASVLLTRARLADALPRFEGKVVLLDADALDIHPASAPASVTGPDDLAYVMYTSGSTGEPRGVLIEHRSVVGHCETYRRIHELSPADRVLMLASYHFDASVEQLFPALLCGASVVVSEWDMEPLRFSRKLVELGVTLLDTSGAHWRGLTDAWLRDPSLMAWSPLRTLVIGGDVMPADVLEPWWRTDLSSRVRLFNCYGPTEATVAATVHEVRREPGPDAARIPIGKPLANRTAYVLDPLGNPVPVGVPGELYLGGFGLARGYLNQPTRTQEKFVELDHLPPPPPGPGGAPRFRRLYRTGDRVRWQPDGSLDFVGRADNQVKIRGYRVELEEIEAHLRRQPVVKDATVIVHEAGGHRSLIGYVVPAGAMRGAEIEAALRASLPEHMVPSRIVELDAIPRITTSGKVDRSALPDPAASEAPVFVAPRTPTEAALVAIFAEVLGCERVGVHDDFFNLGGHSLNATQVIARVNQEFSVRLPLQQIFEHPTPAGLATCLGATALARDLLAPDIASGAGKQGDGAEEEGDL
ncbi:non-ribosomal peptide synthetase [Polyangium sorediatum]|uniref:Non-ribosomal peptide synthetase n=1 Tax=Polyangium sorediatum TaxID=889274 RepID=A0ABT6NYI5_9BACT|nr:non-ribosomal peptide synthetase [Polyangium sorediatum]MDI1433384.1 non-ribosomal peptide synthetase [Polyangium sorediatum]